MLITIAICTWNRAKLLDRTLAGLESLRVPPDVEWELLVVNNNCNDETDKVISAHASRMPLHRLFEPKPGLSNARNCAVKAARGELLLFTDDDVVLDPGWLEAYYAAALRFPSAGFFGGAVRPDYEAPPPRWVEEHSTELRGALALLDLGPEVRPFSGDELPFGASMGFRTKLLRRVSFDPRLGRSKDKLISGEEFLCCQTLLREGHTGVWVGNAVAYHHVPLARMTREYVLKWYAGAGVTEVLSESSLPGPIWFGLPRYMWRRVAQNLIRQVVSVCSLRGRDILASAQLARYRAIRNELRTQRRALVKA